MTANVTRPVLRYHGGKFNLAPWIIAHLPEHRIYVEPFGGAASVLLRKPRSYAEVYNDLDGEVVNLFRVLRNPSQARELVRLLRLTPYARDEFVAAYLDDGDPIEQARRTLVRSWQGFGARATFGMNTGFRTGFRRSGKVAADNWHEFPASLGAVVERLHSVTIENMPAAECIRFYDDPTACFYVDPPYAWNSRNTATAKGNPLVYRHELDDDAHRELAAQLHACKGMALVSGYRCALYDELYADWPSVQRDTHADGGKDRTEVLWIKPNAVRQPDLFGITA